MTITCLVLDDEELAIHHLMKYIAKIPFLKLEGYFTDPSEAIKYLEIHSIDLIFLDIEMPNFSIDGMDFVKIMGDKQHYIFTTAYPEYALPSYDYNVIDFLHKPFSFERFSKSVQKAKLLINASLEDPNRMGDGATFRPLDSDEYTYVRVEGKLQRLDFNEICWIESERNYISIYTETDRINLHLSISEIQEQLPKKLFVRVHKSFIVAQKKVDLIEKGQLRVQRQNQTKLIPLGESFKKAFVQAIEPRTLKKKS